MINGDFETGRFSGWTQWGDTSFTAVATAAGMPAGGSVHGGTYAAYFGPNGSLGGIYQDLNTTTGVNYTLTFWLAHPYTDPGMGTEWTVSAGGATLTDVHDAGNFGYTQFTFTFTATSSSTRLQFGFLEPPQYFFLDDVSVAATSSTSPAVIATTPAAGGVAPPFHLVHVTFNRSMDPTTVTSDNITLTGPSGDIPVTITNPSPDNTQFDVTFDDQTAAGAYTLAIGTGVQDTFGNPITAFSGQYNITSPAVIATTPGAGLVAAPFHLVHVTFNRSMDPTTVTPVNITLTGPSGDIPVMITNPSPDNTQFDVTFDDQTATGAYTLAIGTGVQDTFGNPITPFTPRVFTITNNLVTNGDFETGNFSGWTQWGDTGATGVGSASTLPAGGSVHGGTYAAYFGPTGSLGGIYQDLNTTTGVNYTLTFWLAHPYTSSGTEWTVSAGGTTLTDVHDAANFGYTQFTFTFTATSTTTRLQFGFLEPPSYFFLDDVTVAAT